MNRQLGSFYETPKEDKEKEELKRQVEELTTRLDAKENGAGSMDEQVALMEKSYELAAKYMNGQNGQSVPPQPGQIAQVAPSAPVQGKGNATPVKSVSDKTVSGLQQPMSNSEFIAEYGKPRNYGFNTAVGSSYSMGKNTIRACVHNDQTLMDGQTVKLRLLEPLQAGNVIVPKNSLVSGSAKVQGNGSTYWCPRSNMRVTSFRWNLPFTTVTGKGAFRSLVIGTGSGQRSDGEHRCWAGDEYFFCAIRRAAGRNGYYKGLDAGRITIPRQEIQNGKSTPESKLSGDALRQTTVIYLSTIKISIQMKKLIIMFALLLGVVSMKAQSNDLYQGITKSCLTAKW